MYLTPKELHIAVDNRFKQLNSNRNFNIPWQLKDLALNRAVRKFIEQRCSSKSNPKGDGFEDTQKRYDDIRELLRNEILPVYTHPDYDNIRYSVLPKDYYKLTNDRSSVAWDCHPIATTSSTVTDLIVVLPFLDDTTSGIAPSYYTSFTLYVNGNSITIPELSMLETLNSADSKFTLIHTIIDSINNAGVHEIYWERYDNIYKYNSFIIRSTSTTLVSARFTYLKKNNTTYDSGTVLATSISRKQKSTTHSTVIKPNELIETDIFWDAINTYHFVKNRQNKPISFIEQNRIYVHVNDDFEVTNLHIEYVKEPTLINLKLNQNVELSKTDEIVELAVIELYAIVGDPNYKVMINENLNSE